MGISTGGRRGGVSGSINVTPLIDIVLVLLIIFLVALPVQMRQIPVDVPPSSPGEAPATQPLVLSLHGDGSVDVARGEKLATVTRTELAKTLRPLIDATVTERIVFVDPADDVAYADAISVMDTVRGVGADRVALKLHDASSPVLELAH